MDAKNKVKELRAEADRIEAAERERVRKERQERIRRENEERARVEEERKRKAFAEAGVTGHPKAEKAWAMAYEREHSAGLDDVESAFHDLVELIK